MAEGDPGGDDSDPSVLVGDRGTDPFGDAAASLPVHGTGAWDDFDPDSEPGSPHPFATNEPERYERRAILGWGGMGRVHSARDRRLNRDVALKTVAGPGGSSPGGSGPGGSGSAGPGSLASRRRLAQEAWITARLEHPGIVPVYDAGQTDDGAPFYAMRLVRGRTLAAALEAASEVSDSSDVVALSARLGLLRHYLDVCEAVAYAHQAGIIHRDLKPTNVMVGEFGETQVVDWGVARPVGTVDADLSGGPRGGLRDGPASDGPIPEGHAARTALGAVVGTPAYMSPEQARGRAADPRSDVWSLGVMLWELLVGAPPFAGHSGAELLPAVRAARVPSLRGRSPELPVELVAIAERALARDPSQRYPSARELAADVAAYVDGRRVDAHDYSAWDLLRRLVRRRRAAFVVAGAAFVLLVLVGIVAWQRTSEERDRARAAEASSEATLARSLVQQARVAQRSDARPEAEVLAAHALIRGESARARGVLSAFAGADRPQLQERHPLPDCDRLRLGPGGQELLCVQGPELSLWQLAPLEERWRRRVDVLRTRFFGDEILVGVAPLPSERRGAHTLRLDARTGEPLGEPLPPGSLLSSPTVALIIEPVHVNGRSGRALILRAGEEEVETWPLPIYAQEGVGAISEDGEHVALIGVQSWVVGELGSELRELPLPLENGVASLAWFPDRSGLVLGAFKPEVGFFDLETGELRHLVATSGGPAREVHVARNGDLVAVVGEHGGITLWQPRSGALLSRLPASGPRGAVFDPGGDSLWTVGSEVRRWSLPERLAPQRFLATGGITSVSAASGGRRLGYTAAVGEVGLVELDDGSQRTLPPVSAAVVKDGAWFPDGRSYVVGGVLLNRFVRTDEEWLEVRHSGNTPALRRVGVLADGRVIGGTYGPGLWCWNGESGSTVERHDEVGEIYEIESAADGARALMLDQTGWGVWEWRSGAEAPELLFENSEREHTVAPAPDGDRLALGGRGSVRLLHRDGRVIRELEMPELQADPLPLDLAWSPGGRWLAAGMLDGTVMVWEVETGVLRAVLDGHVERVAAVGFGPAGQMLYTGGWDRRIRSWSMAPLLLDPVDLVATIEQAWGMDLDEALAARLD